MFQDYKTPEDFWANYQKSVDELKNKPEVVELDRLCYEVFEASENGKKLLNILKERFIVPSLVQPNAPNYETILTFYEGFKEAYRLLSHSAESHKQRIKAEEENNG